MEGVDSDGAPVLLVDLGGMLFTFDYEHRLNVLGDCLARPPDASTQLGCTFGGINPYHCGAWFASKMRRREAVAPEGKVLDDS